METRRRIETQKIDASLRQMNHSNTLDEATIQRLRHQVGNEDFNRKRIKGLQEQILQRNTSIESLETLVQDINDGLYDEKFDLEAKNGRTEARDRYDSSKRQKREKKELEQTIQETHRARLFSNRESSEREMRRGLNHYYRATESLPNHIHKNLLTMPANKGYIWRDVTFYGLKPVQKNEPTVLFEKKGSTLVIHEWTPHEYKIWHKNLRTKSKTLQATYPRRRRV